MSSLWPKFVRTESSGSAGVAPILSKIAFACLTIESFPGAAVIAGIVSVLFPITSLSTTLVAASCAGTSSFRAMSSSLSIIEPSSLATTLDESNELSALLSPNILATSNLVSIK